MDHEFCAGLNMIFVHTFTNSPKEMGIPGQEYFAGTHFNPQVTWWDQSQAFIDYMGRIQFVVQKGKFVADVLYYYGDHVPNIATLKESDPAGALPGYDYDVTNEDVLLKLKVVDGEVVVPGGIRYRLLVLPDHKVLSLAVIKKVETLLQEGATVLGTKPERLVSLSGGEEAQKEFHALADNLWGSDPSERGQSEIGEGLLVWGQTAREYLQGEGVAPDFEAAAAQDSSHFDYIHYTIDGADVYFVSNQTILQQSLDAVFRVAGRQPEIWDPVTGAIQKAGAFRQSGGKTIVPLKFDPFGSCLVVFRDRIKVKRQGKATSNYPEFQIDQEIGGPWQVAFDPARGGPASVEFGELADWTQSTDEGIKYYSGKAVYEKTFDCSEVEEARRYWLEEVEEARRYWLELNRVSDVGIAAVELNGRDLGIVWTTPFRVEITGALQSGQNRLKVVVVNNWLNRLIGDRGKPRDESFTRTNIKIRDDWYLQESGLLGPVRVVHD